MGDPVTRDVPVTPRVLARIVHALAPTCRARTRWVVPVAVGLASSGCAERRLVTEPETAPGTTTWAVVTIAAVLAALVLGVLLTLPAWRARTGARLAVAVLAAHVGAVVLGGVVLAGTALRSWQLVDRPVEAAAEPALVRLSSVDGDGAFFALMLLVIVALTALVACLLVLAARWAATDDVVGRVIASIVLGLLVLVGIGSAVTLIAGSEAWPHVVAASATPVSATAVVTCWPRRTTT
jgi:hypothetical protein